MGEENEMSEFNTIVIIRQQLQPGKEDVALNALRALVGKVLENEPDCGGIQMLQNDDDPSQLTMVERWTSREAYEGPHMQTEYIQAFIASTGEFAAGPPDISYWHDAK